MWSGPRNVSTALLRSFGARADTLVVDEPLYAHYLATTGLDHPGRDDVIAAGETDWRSSFPPLNLSGLHTTASHRATPQPRAFLCIRSSRPRRSGSSPR